MSYLSVAVQVLERNADLISRVGPGEWGCVECGFVAVKSEFPYGRGRSYGQHPDSRYCPACGHNLADGVVSMEIENFRRRHPLAGPRWSEQG